MYGGLFGDLPSAKTSEGKDGEETEEPKVQVPPTSASSKAVATTTAAAGVKQPGILTGLGNAGTSMAFVPTTLRPRKRPNPSGKSRATSSTNKPSSVNKRVAMEPAVKVQAIKQEEGTSPIKQEEEDVVPPPAKIKQEAFPLVIENMHAVLDHQPENVAAPSLEDEELQRLHSSVTDPYDPHVPNDLLAYRERMKIEQQRMQLEREARETRERQQRLRQQVEEERQRIQQSGATANEIIAHRTKRTIGGGRGRGVNNLPAWLLQKQKDELGQNPPAAAIIPDTATRTVILSNLTSPGDIDNELAEEVQEECEEACGPVQRVEIKDAKPPHQPEVQVWVQFQSVGDAHKAANLFHGRIFGKRRITAKRELD
jgi:hypothetical protein